MLSPVRHLVLLRMRFHSHLRTAAHVISECKGEIPFSAYLKSYFYGNKKHGSKDRKHISHLCYCYFRMGQSLRDSSIEDKILSGLFLCADAPDELLQDLKPEWNENVALPVAEKCSMINFQFTMLNVFPWKEELSNGIDHEQFTYSFFVQPDLFIRIRPGNDATVYEKLDKCGIEFKKINDTCLSFPNATKIDQVLDLNKEAVIQDYSSQQVFQSEIRNQKSEIRKVWDCCAGSGGKSILAYDALGKIDLTVSDIRESILTNLKNRFRKAGIRNYTRRVVDLSDSPLTIDHSPFDLIIADVPCTGSGTWSRTPEALNYFDPKEIERYSLLQKKIVSNIIPSLKPCGYFLYITCSVFKKENEDVVKFLEGKCNLKIKEMKLLKGYDKKADTMFVALLSH